MFPLPHIGLPDASIGVDGDLRLLGAIAVIALFAAYALLLWAMRFSRTRTVRCPDQGRKAQVLFHFAADGTPDDIEGCSLQRTKADCSMRCLPAA